MFYFLLRLSNSFWKYESICNAFNVFTFVLLNIIIVIFTFFPDPTLAFFVPRTFFCLFFLSFLFFLPPLGFSNKPCYNTIETTWQSLAATRSGLFFGQTRFLWDINSFTLWLVAKIKFSTEKCAKIYIFHQCLTRSPRPPNIWNVHPISKIQTCSFAQTKQHGEI